MIPFTKAHACGNDFLIVTEEAAAGHEKVELARHLCQRGAACIPRQRAIGSAYLDPENRRQRTLGTALA